MLVAVEIVILEQQQRDQGVAVAQHRAHHLLDHRLGALDIDLATEPDVVHQAVDGLDRLPLQKLDAPALFLDRDGVAHLFGALPRGMPKAFVEGSEILLALLLGRHGVGCDIQAEGEIDDHLADRLLADPLDGLFILDDEAPAPEGVGQPANLQVVDEHARPQQVNRDLAQLRAVRDE